MGENETKWVGGRERSVALLPPEEGMPTTDPDQVMPQEFIPVWQKGVSRERGRNSDYIVSRAYRNTRLSQEVACVYNV